MICSACGHPVGRPWHYCEEPILPAYAIPPLMELLYDRLRELGFVESSSEPDEWLNEEHSTEVLIEHTASQCRIRYRRVPENTGSHSIDTEMAHARRQPWNSLSRAHSGTSTDFAKWLGQSAQTIETAMMAYSNVARAPGEGPESPMYVA